MSEARESVFNAIASVHPSIELIVLAVLSVVMLGKGRHGGLTRFPVQTLSGIWMDTINSLLGESSFMDVSMGIHEQFVESLVFFNTILMDFLPTRSQHFKRVPIIKHQLF
jgi:hypothetical protein